VQDTHNCLILPLLCFHSCVLLSQLCQGFGPGALQVQAAGFHFFHAVSQMLPDFLFKLCIQL
jgi:hypothetical protein